MQQLIEIHQRMERGDVRGALAAIDAVIRGMPRDARAHHLSGVIRRRVGDPNGAIKAFEQAGALGLESAELANSLGLARQEAGLADAALAAFDAALGRDSLYEPAVVNRARLLAELGRFDEAEASLRTYLADQKASISARNALASVLRDAGRPREAVTEYRTVLAADPGSRIAAVRLGQTLRDFGAEAQALDHFRAYAQGHVATPEFVESHAGALLAAGEVEEAFQMLERLVASAPAYLPGHRALARATREFELGGDPYRSYRRLVETWPGEPAIWQDWLALLLGFRDYALILEVADRPPQEIRTTPFVALARAIALSELGRAEAAEDAFAGLDVCLQERVDVLTARTRNFLRLHEPLRAAELANAITRCEPFNQIGWAYLGLAWRLLGDPRELWLNDYARQVTQIAMPHLQDPAALDGLRVTLGALHRARHHPPDQTLRGGTQTEGALFARADPLIATLSEGIREAVEDFARTLPVDDTHPFYARRCERIRFTGSWSVRLRSEGYHIAHVHERGWVSSALHLAIPSDAGSQSGEGWLALGEPPDELGLALPPRRTVQPREGWLVLFPSMMWHGTRPFADRVERLTVAFDAVPA